MNARRKASVVFAVLATYVVIQFLWWAYLLLDLNADYFQLKQELHIAWGVPDKVDLTKELRQKRYMIFGEGLIFFALLLVGIVLTARYMVRDARLSRLQHNFLLSVTHELKTPIAATQLYLQTLQKRELEVERKRQILESALKSNQRLEQLVEKLLLATQLDSAKVEIQSVEVALLPVIEQAIETVRSIDQKDHAIELNGAETAVVRGDIMALETMVLNLLENAVKYAPAGSTVAVQVEEQGGQVRFMVANDGYIAPQDQKQVFTKFFRAGSEETRTTKGTGVGLYLVQSLARLHGGNIELDVAEGKVSFTLILPSA